MGLYERLRIDESTTGKQQGGQRQLGASFVLRCGDGVMRRGERASPAAGATAAGDCVANPVSARVGSGPVHRGSASAAGARLGVRAASVVDAVANATATDYAAGAMRLFVYIIAATTVYLFCGTLDASTLPQNAPRSLVNYRGGGQLCKGELAMGLYHSLRIDSSGIGSKFGRWTQIGPTFKLPTGTLNKYGKRDSKRWAVCKCACGHIQLVGIAKLAASASNGCRGCRLAPPRIMPVIHGKSGSAMYRCAVAASPYVMRGQSL